MIGRLGYERRDPMNATITTKSVEEIRAEMAHLQGLLSEIQGDHGLCIWDGMSGTLEDTPDGPGFILHVMWAIQDRSYDLWFREIEPAKAALLRVAQEKGCVPSASGLSVDLTAPGCHDSRAWIESVNAPKAKEVFKRDRVKHLPDGGRISEGCEFYDRDRDKAGDHRPLAYRTEDGELRIASDCPRGMVAVLLSQHAWVLKP